MSIMCVIGLPREHITGCRDGNRGISVAQHQRPQNTNSAFHVSHQTESFPRCQDEECDTMSRNPSQTALCYGLENDAFGDAQIRYVLGVLSNSKKIDKLVCRHAL